jgi:MerR family transcriptional regulator, thiopeptide resistance regulator
MNYKIGQLAKITGLTVRTLHYYEQMGLLAQAERSANGYRTYGQEDVDRLQRISILKNLGFSLEQVKNIINNPSYSLAKILPLQIEQLKLNIRRQEMLLGKLKAVKYYSQNPSPELAEQFFKIMSQLKNMNADFNQEEWDVVKAQGAKLGDDHIRKVEAEWPELIKKVQKMIANKIDPKDERVGPLAKRWMELVKEFTGGHKGVEQKVGKMYQQNAANLTLGDPNGTNMAECMNYIQKALK